MKDDKIIIRTNQEDRPKNRKDIVLMKYRAVTDAIAGDSIDRKIDAIIDFICVASAELPDSDYDGTIIFSLEPSFEDMKNSFLEQCPILVPESLYMHIGRIQLWRKQKYLRLLQKELVKVEMLLKNHIGWCFEKETKQINI